MNRIRKLGDQYQVLLTPHHRFHSGIELMLGNWTDKHLGNYYVETYRTMEDAMQRSYNFPDVNWDQLVIYHKDIYAKLFEIIRYEIDVNNLDMTLEPIILNSYQTKNLMFDRIIEHGERFRPIYHMNDIISFHITNPYSANLNELAEILSTNQQLRIQHKTRDFSGAIKLVGKTDIGTSYEIILSSSLVANWKKWAMKNPQIPDNIKMDKLKTIVKQQKTIDQNVGLR
jgi:hypothetical protein